MEYDLRLVIRQACAVKDYEVIDKLAQVGSLLTQIVPPPKRRIPKKQIYIFTHEDLSVFC